MSEYTTPILTALILFLFLGSLLTLPWLIYTYRKNGFFSWWNFFVTYSFVFYMLCALFLIILPLPATRDTCALQAPGTVHYSLVPFSFVRDIKDAGIIWSQPSTYVQIFSQLAFLQAVFNFLLLFPLGIYLRYFFQKKYSWLRALGLSFALSLFYEITQLTAIYGLFNCPYRIFDVDDLILNSTGSLCGFWLAPIVLSLFPSQQDLLAKREQMLRRESVPPAAQLVAVAIDMVLIEITWSWIGHFLLPIDLKWLYRVLGFLIVFFLIPLVWKGKTLGTRIMRFRLIPTETDQSLQISLLTRTIALYLPLEASELLGLLGRARLNVGSGFYPVFIWIQVGALLAIFLIRSAILLHIAIVVAKKGRQSFYFDFAAHLLPSRGCVAKSGRS